LAEDAILRMPPEEVEILGRAAVVNFFATVPAAGHLDRFSLKLVRANDSWAVAAFLPDESRVPAAYGIMVLASEAGAITEIMGFPMPSLFPHFGLSIHCLPQG